MSFLIEFKEYRERESKSLEFVRGAYEFTEKQKEVWKNTIETYHRWNISIGATRSGKTFLDYFKIPYRIQKANKDGIIIILGNTESTLERNLLDPMRKIWGDDRVGKIGAKNKIRLFGKDAYAIGADKITQVKRLQGAGASYIYGDEVTTWSEEVFEMLKSRLDKKGSCFDGTCNPDNPNHWFKKFLDNDSGTDIYSMKFIIDDNTHLDADFVETLKREYAGKVYYDRYILGEWAIAEGAIYGGFKPSQVVNAPPKILEYSVGIDYGQSNATVFLLCGRGIDGRLYILSEYYHSGRERGEFKTALSYGKDFMKWCAGYFDIRGLKRNLGKVYYDPSALGFATQLSELGVDGLRKADNEVLKGIRLVSAMFEADLIRVCGSCVNFIKEVQGYSWDAKAAKLGEDKPIKVDDHCMDAFRYLVIGDYNYWRSRLGAAR